MRSGTERSAIGCCFCLGSSEHELYSLRNAASYQPSWSAPLSLCAKYKYCYEMATRTRRASIKAAMVISWDAHGADRVWRGKANSRQHTTDYWPNCTEGVSSLWQPESTEFGIQRPSAPVSMGKDCAFHNIIDFYTQKLSPLPPTWLTPRSYPVADCHRRSD